MARHMEKSIEEVALRDRVEQVETAIVAENIYLRALDTEFNMPFIASTPPRSSHSSRSYQPIQNVLL